jgi:hypothetical protein
MRRDATRGTHAPATVRASSLPPRVVDDIAALVPALTAASAAVECAVLARERAVLDALRRKSHAQHRSSKHHAALTRACKRSRDYDAVNARAKLAALAADADACARAGRAAYGGDALVMPARASADECMRALYASCALLDELRGASEACVEAFAGQLARGYFMPLSATATACASRVRCESSRGIEELVKAYNVVARVRESLPPPGRFGSAKGEGGNEAALPPAELRVAAAEDGSARAVALGDDKVKTDEELDVRWRGALVSEDAGEKVATPMDVGDADIFSDLGVRVDRADVAMTSSQDVVRVAKSSQVPQTKARKYEHTVKPTMAGGLGLGAMDAPTNPFASKKRRRKKKSEEDPKGAADKKKQKKEQKEREKPKNAMEAIERLRQLSGCW